MKKINISTVFTNIVYFNEAGTHNVHLKPISQAKKYKQNQKEQCSAVYTSACVTLLIANEN